MEDATLKQAIDQLRRESEAEAADLSAATDRELRDAGDAAAQETLGVGQYVTVKDLATVQAFFDDEMRRRVVDKLGPMIERAVARDAAGFAKATGLPLRPDQLDRLAEAMRFNLDWLPRLPEMTSAWLSDQLRGAVLGKIPTLEVVDGLRRHLGTTVQRYAATQVETTLQVMDQLTINVATAELGYDLDLYAGPDDLLTREFCDHLVNRAFPHAALQASRNGQIPNVPVSRGGYRCRHRVRPILRRTVDFLKIPLVDPYRMVELQLSAGHPERGVPPRVIVYPVPA